MIRIKHYLIEYFKFKHNLISSGMLLIKSGEIIKMRLGNLRTPRKSKKMPKRHLRLNNRKYWQFKYNIQLLGKK